MSLRTLGISEWGIMIHLFFSLRLSYILISGVWFVCLVVVDLRMTMVSRHGHGPWHHPGLPLVIFLVPPGMESLTKDLIQFSTFSSSPTTLRRTQYGKRMHNASYLHTCIFCGCRIRGTHIIIPGETPLTT